MKKLLCLAVCFAMVMSIAGCSGTKDEAGTSAAASSGTSAEKTTLTVFTHPGVNSSYPPPSNDLDFWKYMEERTNVHIEWETAPYENYSEVIATKISAGVDLPDILNVSMAKSATDAGRNGVLIDISGMLEEHAPHTTKFLNENAFAKALWTEANGAIYGLHATVSAEGGHIVYIYNKDWLDQLGRKIPTTTDEFLDLTRAMVGVDFNKNGLNDEIILSSYNAEGLDMTGDSFGLMMYENWDAFQADKNGVVTPDYTRDGMKDWLSWLNTMYKENILDKEIFTNTFDLLSEKVASDRVGIFVCYSAFANLYGNLTPKGLANINSEVYSLGTPLKGPNGDQYIVRREKDGNDITGITKDCKQPEVALKWLDTLYADPEVIDARYWGTEGKTYTVNSKGEKELLMPTDGSAWSVQQYGGGQIALAHIQTVEGLNRPRSNVSWYIDQYNEVLPYFISPSVPHINFNDKEQEIIDRVQTDIKTYFREMQAKFVTGATSFDEWDNYVSTMKKLGLDDFTSVYQSIYDRTR